MTKRSWTVCWKRRPRGVRGGGAAGGARSTDAVGAWNIPVVGDE